MLLKTECVVLPKCDQRQYLSHEEIRAPFEALLEAAEVFREARPTQEESMPATEEYNLNKTLMEDTDVKTVCEIIVSRKMTLSKFADTMVARGVRKLLSARQLGMLDEQTC